MEAVSGRAKDAIPKVILSCKRDSVERVSGQKLVTAVSRGKNCAPREEGELVENR